VRGWIDHCPDRWIVLAARPNARAAWVAFAPLAIDRTPRWFRLDRQVTLRLGACPMADYSGFVCRPNHEHRALVAMAAFARDELHWDRFEMREVADRRLRRWITALAGDGAGRLLISQQPGMPCPQMQLPATWEAYLHERVSTATRKTIRRRLRGLERVSDLRIVDVNRENLDRQIGTLMTLWTQRWPGYASPAQLQTLPRIMAQCFEDGSLWLRTLWQGDRPMAAVCGFVDGAHRRFHGYLLGVNPIDRRLSLGTVLIAQAIRHSIESGLQHFDFLRGNEEYKYSFGATDRFNQTAVATRRRLRTRVRNAIEHLRNQLAVRTRARAAIGWCAPAPHGA
jgi:CelD/BcsL family acetyltransferase involved in cellulose biosynthesis